MKKELYTTPEMEVTYFEAEDVITTSTELEEEDFSLFDLKLPCVLVKPQTSLREYVICRKSD